jgi:alanine racemase
MRIATVPIGYADGFVRHFAGASLRLKDGTPAPVVGRICMDQCMIDIGGSDVRPGDSVTIFGGDDGSMIEDLARRGSTINYEITCILTPRVPRIVRE